MIVTDYYPECAQSPKERDLPKDLTEIDFMENILIDKEEELFETLKAPGMLCEVCVGNYRYIHCGWQYMNFTTNNCDCVCTDSTNNTTTTEKSKRRTAIQRALDVQEKKLKFIEQHAETEDEDMFFLKSLHPYLLQIPT